MPSTPDEGAVAHHLVVALLSDMAIQGDPRLPRMQDLLAKVRRDNPDWSEQDLVDLEFAQRTVRQLVDTPRSSG